MKRASIPPSLRFAAIAAVMLCCAAAAPAEGAEPEPAGDAWDEPAPLEPPAADLDRYARGFRLDPREFTFTQRYFWRRLFNPSGHDRAVGIGLLLGALALEEEKRNLQAEVAETDSPQRKRFLRSVQTLGDQGVVPGVALLFYLGGSTFGSYRAKETGYLLGQSALLTAILTGAGKWAINEQRPREGGEVRPFQGMGHGVSGHTATAASIAGVLSRMYLKVDPDDGRAARVFKRIGKGFAYGLPILVGASRVNEQQHFAYNSLLGAGIGFWVSHVVVDAHEEYLGERRPSPWKPDAVGPIFDDEGRAGLGARWEF